MDYGVSLHCVTKVVQISMFRIISNFELLLILCIKWASEIVSTLAAVYI